MYRKNKGFILKLRDSKTFRGITVLVLLNFIFEMAQPSVSLALTEGPSQPEVQSFEPIGTNQMVDLFTGDFNYNIPLFNLPGPNGGYPVNLAYHAGATMDDEASWVGLGWNINVGSLVRNMRGLPDEFQSTPDGETGNASAAGDYLEVKSDMKENWTLGVTGSLTTEFFGVSGAEDASLSASVYYNNYNGVGLSVGGQSTLGSSSNFSLGLSLDSENGLGVSGSLSLKDEAKNAKYKHTFGFTFDGSLSVNYSLTSKKKVGELASGERVYARSESSSYGNSYTFARNSFSPSLSNRVNNYSLSLNVEGGVAGMGIFTGGSVGLFYNTQDFHKEDKEGRKHLVVGYNNMGEVGVDENFAKDFTRYNDGQITKANVFLPVSSYDYDVYNSTGQGLSGYFRPYRADVGSVHDPYVYNNSFGLSGSLEVGQASGTEAGIDFGGSYGFDKQGPWRDNNQMTMDFMANNSGLKESVYLKAHGELTILDPQELDHINGLNLAVVKFDENVPNDGDNPGQRHIRWNTNPGYHTERVADKRPVRNTVVHNLKNSEVDKYGEFKIDYFTSNNFLTGETVSLERDFRNGVNIANHPAGYKVLNQEGSYYVYALPAYNNSEIENLFSVPPPEDNHNVRTLSYATHDDEADYKLKEDGADLNFTRSHKFIHKTKKSPYAHSYLLTSVQGADYVDIENDGPTDDDLGYWVKFNYFQKASNYKWRSPYTAGTAYYNRGMSYTADDDKASYSYGEKEIWYMARMETKSHIAVFKLSERQDMKSAGGEHSGSGSQQAMKLDKIQIFEKKSFLADPDDAVPLQEIHFDYAYELCPGTPNSAAPDAKKLTLKHLWMTYNGSQRGSLSKYDFDYGTQAFDNPVFKEGAYDSWGNYRDRDDDNDKVEHQVQFPYVNQFNQDWLDGWEPDYTSANGVAEEKQITKQTQDQLVSAWCLKRIKLPSGGEINIEYESDDYAYVQHKRATQMMKVHKLGDFQEPDEVYNAGDEDFYDEESGDDEARRRIYFKLEEPLSGDQEQVAQKIYNDYVEPLIEDENHVRNLYFKAKMRLTNEVHDYVSGYLPLEEGYKKSEGGLTIYNCGVLSGGEYGFVTLQAAKRKNGQYFHEYHPMALLGWTYLQTNAQRLLNNPNSFEDDNNNEGFFEKIGDLLNKMADLVNIIPATANSFGFIRPYCKSKDMARFIDLDYSCIRLASPDRVKYGGGHRVKQISITDNWSADSGEQDRTYGQVYDYTMKEEGETEVISSGVAQYEPQAGGDENALKYPFYYFDKQNAFTNNNLFTEAPINEHLYPGPSVGYRKVSVRSIHTDEQEKSTTPKGRTGGVAVHEFYTAKEFPTITSHSKLEEEGHTKDVFKLWIPIPLVGGIKHNHYHGSQAYMIELNDMHGKPKSVKSFELNNYTVNQKPITETIYEYQAIPKIYNKEKCFVLDNLVSIIPNDGNHQIAAEKRYMGLEYDMFTDQRESRSMHTSAGAEINIDVPITVLGVPFPSFWGNFTNTKNLFRTYVTNKVIHRAGILKKTITRDLQSSNESEILAYDEKSGQPLLSKMKNEFGDDFYSYNIPAYYHYDRMGHAYENINYTFTTSIDPTEHSHSSQYVTFDPQPEQEQNLFRGDELIIYKANGTSISNSDNYKKGYFIGWTVRAGQTYGLLYFDQGLHLQEGVEATQVTLKVVRSGRRNHYSSMVANYVTKGNPLENLSDLSLNDNGYLATTKTFPANKVLSASATVYNDNWASNYTFNEDPYDGNYDPGTMTGDGDTQDGIDYNNGGAINRVKNPFLNGNSGIWRIEKSYSYVGPRKINADMTSNGTQDPKLFEDGVFTGEVPMFSWDLGYMEDHVPEWEWVNEVTRYSLDSYETENRNRLGIFSSALYGYDNSLSIGVGGNSSYYEMGFDDFETANTADPLFDSDKRTEQNNLNFYKNKAESDSWMINSEHADIKHAVYNSNGTLTVYLENISEYMEDFMNVANIKKEENGNDYLNSTFGITLKSKKYLNDKGNKGYYFNGVVKQIAQGIVPKSLQITIKPFFHCANETALELITGAAYHGKLTVFEKRPAFTWNYSNVEFTATKAHTGKRSLSVNGTAFFDQPKLKMVKNKKYIWSMWVSRDNTDVRSYETNNLVVPLVMNEEGQPVDMTTSYTVRYGKVVEGWQKVDIELSVGTDNPVIGIRFNTGNSKLYIDDIRFSPKTGGMTTYVYDPAKFWLRANLNVDNYATLFFYDEQGNLSLKKQETEKGIFTITESRGHVSED